MWRHLLQLDADLHEPGLLPESDHLHPGFPVLSGLLLQRAADGRTGTLHNVCRSDVRHEDRRVLFRLRLPQGNLRFAVHRLSPVSVLLCEKPRSCGAFRCELGSSASQAARCNRIGLRAGRFDEPRCWSARHPPLRRLCDSMSSRPSGFEHAALYRSPGWGPLQPRTGVMSSCVERHRRTRRCVARTRRAERRSRRCAQNREPSTLPSGDRPR